MSKVLQFFRNFFGITDIVPSDTPTIPVVSLNNTVDTPKKDFVVIGDTVVEYYDITGSGLDQEATLINIKENTMSNDAIVVAEIQREVTEAIKLIDGLLYNPDLKALPATYRKAVTKILEYKPNYTDGHTATAALDWYEDAFQVLVNAVFAGKIKNVTKPTNYDPAGRIVHANQAIEWAYKNLLAKGINLHDFGSKHTF